MVPVRRASAVLVAFGCVALFLVSSTAPCLKCPVDVSDSRPDPPLVDDGRVEPAVIDDETKGYVRQQTSKLETHLETIQNWDANEIEPQLTKRFRNAIREKIQGRAVLCVGARLGGEVRAFKNLGALALGVDLNPGLENKFVLHGSATSLQFASGVFDIVYTNILDHIDDLVTFFIESKRVMKPSALLMVDIDQNAPDEWSVRDLRGQVPTYIQTIEGEGFTLLADDIVLNEKDRGKHALIFGLGVNRSEVPTYGKV